MNAQTLDDPAANDAVDRRGRRRRSGGSSVGIVLLVVLLVVGLRYRAAHSTTQLPGGGAFGGGGPIAVGVAQVTTGDVPITINALGTVTPLATVTVHPQVNRPADQDRLRRRPDGQGGRPAGADRSASVPGGARSGRGSAANATRPCSPMRGSTWRATRRCWRRTRCPIRPTPPRSRRCAQDEATVASDQAAVEAARLNLSYCRITRPSPAGRVCGRWISAT